MPGLANAHAYWTGLGVTAEIEDIATEAAQLERLLGELSAVRFVEAGAGHLTIVTVADSVHDGIDLAAEVRRLLQAEFAPAG